MIVYRIYDKLTGKNYIGQTARPLNRRIYAHLHDKRSIVGRAMNEAGRQNFDISVLDVCETKEAADQAEKFWIDFYDAIENGYNVVAGGSPDKKYMDMLRGRIKNHTGGRKKKAPPKEKVTSVPKSSHVKGKPIFTARELYNAEARFLQQIAWRQSLPI